MLGSPRQAPRAAPDRGLSPARARWHTWPVPFPWVCPLLLRVPGRRRVRVGLGAGWTHRADRWTPIPGSQPAVFWGVLLFVVYSGHPPNAMLGRGTWESVFVHWRVTSQMLGTRPERRSVCAQGCVRARLLLVFSCWLFLSGFWVWFQTSVVPSKMFPLVEPYIGTSAARRVVGSEQKTQMPEKTMPGRRAGVGGRLTDS